MLLRAYVLSLYAIKCKHTDSKTWPGKNVNSRRTEYAVMDCPQCLYVTHCRDSVFAQRPRRELRKLNNSNRDFY